MPDGSKPWYETFVSPLKRAFARHGYRAARRDELGDYQYDESDFVVFTEACLDEDVDPKKGRSAAGFIGTAEFRYVQDPFLMTMPFAVDEIGKRITGQFSLEYDDVPRRIRMLKENGILPTESERALRRLDALLTRQREKAGLESGRVMEFPSKAL